MLEAGVKRKLVVAILALLFCCCSGPQPGPGDVVQRPAQSPQQSNSATATDESYIPDQLGPAIGEVINTFTDQSRLTTGDYEIRKLTRIARNDSRKGETEIQYAVLRHNGRVIGKFDTPSLDGLAEVRFGLFSFLGRNENQLVIEQRADKFWRYWIIGFQRGFTILYDSNDYDLVYELRVIDLNGDGYSEVVQNVGTFWYFDPLDNLYSPRPPVVFEYSPHQRSYKPANFVFKDTLLKDVNERIARTQQVSRKQHEPNSAVHMKSAMLDLLLRYVYTGGAAEGWKLYDELYNLEDKAQMKESVLDRLRQDRLYINQQADARKTMGQFQRKP